MESTTKARLLMSIFFWTVLSYGQSRGNVRFQNLSLKDGLSQSVVMWTLQDENGFMWIATQDGLNRYDGYQFVIFRRDVEDPHSLSSNHITSLARDDQGALWVGTLDSGLNRLTPGTRDHFTRFVSDPDNPHSLHSNEIRGLLVDREGGLWASTRRGGVSRINTRDPESMDHYLPDPYDPNSISDETTTYMAEGPDGSIWISSLRNGLNRFDPRTGHFSHYRHDPEDPNSLSSDRPGSLFVEGDLLWIGSFQGVDRLDTRDGTITRHPFPNHLKNRVASLYRDKSGYLWIATASKGLLCMHPDKRDAQGNLRFYQNVHIPGSDTSLGFDQLLHMSLDREGGLWVGTYGNGLSRFYPEEIKGFASFTYEYNQPDSLSENLVWSVFRDRRGSLWVGTSAGLDQLDPRHHHGFTHFSHRTDDPRSISRGDVSNIKDDAQGRLWIATLGGGLNSLELDQIDAGFTHYRHDPDDAGSISANDIVCLFVDREEFLWAGTLNEGLNIMDPQKPGRFKLFRNDPNNPQSLSSNFILSIQQDHKGTLWFGTSQGGLNRQMAPGVFRHYANDPKNPNSLSHNDVATILDDRKRGLLWLGTLGGLNAFDPENETFRIWTERDGLPNDTIYGILMDEQQRLWLSSNRGLAVLNPETGEIRTYDAGDGLAGDEFNSGSCFQDPDGQMFFGGIHGLTTFQPKDIRINTLLPHAMLTDLLLTGESVALQHRDPQSPLEKPIEMTQSLVFNHNQRMITFEFAALHFARPDKNRFRYRLSPFNDEWIETDALKRYATYTNLDPGHYVFEVLASNKDGKWGTSGQKINVRVLPAPWKTWWAITLYILFILLGIGNYIATQRRQLAAERLRAEKDRQIAVQLSRLDAAKDEFLANTSHELRTPLNGIIGLTESLLDGARGPVAPEVADELSLVVSAGKRLASLVNDLLDFSQLRNQHLELERKPVDMHALTEVVLSLSRPLARGKELELINMVPQEDATVCADENRLQQIMHNLVGNAIKFTERGSVTVSALHGEALLEVTVRDTGIGIAEKDTELIFDSFQQLDGAANRRFEGAGLGLAITRQLVELHGGTIRVESTLNTGSSFIFTMPRTESPQEPETLNQLKIEHDLTAARMLHYDEEPAQRSEPTEPVGDSHVNQAHILIVDDEAVNRRVLANHLSVRGYRITESSSGPEALETIERNRTVDLILLDLMMPGMSGYEVCRILRRKFPVLELPILILTARHGEMDIKTGFDAGANDYLAKPVSKEELLARVRTHLSLCDTHRHLELKVAERTRELEHTNDELKDKNREILRRQDQLITQEKMASLGTLTTGIAHELKNPLNFVNNFAGISRELFGELEEILRQHFKERPPEELAELLDDLVDNVRLIAKNGIRASGIVDRMMELSGDGPGAWQVTDVNELVGTIIDMVCRSGKVQELLIDKRFTGNLGTWYLVPTNLSRALVNLLNNAVEAVEERKEIADRSYQPQIEVTTRVEDDTLMIIIRDNGSGIDAENLSHIYTPFYTTRSADSGHIGLGLPLCYEIVVREHEGRLEVISEKGNYTECTMSIPRHLPPGSAMAPASSVDEVGVGESA